MTKTEELTNKIRSVLSGQHYGVYNTIRNKTPHSTLVCFGFTDDLSKIFFYSPTQSRKFINSQLYNHVTIFVDTRENKPSDLKNAVTIAATGKAVLGKNLPAEDIAKYRERYLSKNSHMDFFVSDAIDMMVIEVEKFEIVMNFQSVYSVENDKNFVIHIRQLQGKPVQNGFARGKQYHLNPKGVVDTNQIVVCNSGDRLPSKPFAGLLVIGDASIYANNPQLEGKPIVSIDSSNENIIDNAEISIDGNHGIVIFHEVNK